MAATDFVRTSAHVAYLLHLADNALVLGQRNAEWCGHGPVLEEDIALANISLDLIGQARLLYQHVASLLGTSTTEDSLAYFRDAVDFRNFTLVELPHSISANQTHSERDYAVTIVRNFLYSAFMVLLWEALKKSSDPQLAAIAERSIKEVRYHLRHSCDWLVRLGDGTADSHARTQAALDYLMPLVPEFWAQSAIEIEAMAQGFGVTGASLQSAWEQLTQPYVTQATLQIKRKPESIETTQVKPQGKNGQHSDHLATLLADMQSLARQHPGATW